MREAKGRIHKLLFLLQGIVLFLCPVCLSLTAEAGYRSLSAADWEENNERVIAVWEPELEQDHYLQLYKDGTADACKKGKPIRISGVKKEITSYLCEYGIGTYYYTISPDKTGGSVLITSTPYEYTVDLWKVTKKQKIFESISAAEGQPIDLFAEGPGGGQTEVNPTAAFAAGSGLKAVEEVRINAAEEVREEGKPCFCSLSVIGSGFDTVETVWSKAPETWIAGEAVHAKIVIRAKDGYAFANGTKYSAVPSLTLKTNTGDAAVRTFDLVYTPKRYLMQPDCLYIDADKVLHWSKVEGADHYLLTIRTETDAEAVEVKAAEYDLSGVKTENTRICLSARGAVNSKTVKASEIAVIEDLAEFIRNNSVPGQFTLSGEKYTYCDESGEKAAGWYQMPGGWMYFVNGTAVGPGWHQDKASGLWYYFDKNCRMVTGKVVEGNKEYILNDGSRTDLPLGAWTGEEKTLDRS